MINWDAIKETMEMGLMEIEEWLNSEYVKIHSGAANPKLLADVNIRVYGDIMPLNQIANISHPEPRQLLVKPYDKTTKKDIYAGLEASGIRMTLQDNGDSIRVIFAPLTEETRRENARKAKSTLEDSKVKLRNVRHDAQSMYKKSDDVSDDDKKFYEEQLNNLTKELSSKLDAIYNLKEKELMKI